MESNNVISGLHTALKIVSNIRDEYLADINTWQLSDNYRTQVRGLLRDLHSATFYTRSMFEGLMQPTQIREPLPDHHDTFTAAQTASFLPIKMWKENLLLILKGPQHTTGETQATRGRKVAVNKRCVKLRKLAPSSLLWWSGHLPKTAWGKGEMPDRTFQQVLQQVHSRKDLNPMVPSIDYVHAFEKLGIGNEVRHLTTYLDILKVLRGMASQKADHQNIMGVDVPPIPIDGGSANESTGRISQSHYGDNFTSTRIISIEGQQVGTPHTFSNPPLAAINGPPQPLRTLIQSSDIWRGEIELQLPTTTCLSTSIPKNDTGAGFMTVSCDPEEMYRRHETH